jgi:hypothetical protein
VWQYPKERIPLLNRYQLRKKDKKRKRRRR